MPRKCKENKWFHFPLLRLLLLTVWLMQCNSCVNRVTDPGVFTFSSWIWAFPGIFPFRKPPSSRFKHSVSLRLSRWFRPIISCPQKPHIWKKLPFSGTGRAFTSFTFPFLTSNRSILLKWANILSLLSLVLKTKGICRQSVAHTCDVDKQIPELEVRGFLRRAVSSCCFRGEKVDVTFRGWKLWNLKDLTQNTSS